LDLKGRQVEISLYQKIKLYDEKSVTLTVDNKPLVSKNPLLSQKGKATALRQD
jgi:hypothetical protein